MKYCPNCGAPIIDASRFCKSCGTPVANANGSGLRNSSAKIFENSSVPEAKGEFTLGSWDDDDAPATIRKEELKPSRNPKLSKPSMKNRASGGFLKNMGKGLIAAVLPIVLSALGYGGYSYFLNNDGVDKADPICEQPTEQTTEQPVEQSTELPTQPVDVQTPVEPDLIDLEETQGIVSVSDEEAEQQLKNIEQRSSNRFEDSYTGTWKSVGVCSMKFKDFKDLSNLHKATYIAMNMKEVNSVSLTFGNGHMKLSVNGKTSLEGNYTILSAGDVELKTSAGEVGNFWMYSDVDGELYCYIRYVEDDGTEMASGIKLKRISKNV